MKECPPILTPPFINAPVLIWQKSPISASCSTTEFVFIMQFSPIFALALTITPCPITVPDFIDAELLTMELEAHIIGTSKLRFFKFSETSNLSENL